MKRRTSVSKAEWSDEREKLYKMECLEIVFDFGDKLEVENGSVFIIKKEKTTELEKPENHKTFWYETWLKVRVFYQID